MRVTLVALLLAAGTTAAQAQSDYTFQMRLIADGDSGYPAGNWPQFSINANGGSAAITRATRIGFWLQARVAQTSGENWGIVRATSPEGGASFISSDAPGELISLSRGSTSPATSSFPRYGRNSGYRNGGEQTGNTGNAPGSAPFPGTSGNENGGLDNGGSGSFSTRVYAFDAYVGSTRPALLVDEAPTQPWGVNGAASGPWVGDPVPSDGTFSPWASLYRVWVEVTVPMSVYEFDVTISASAWLTGAIQAVPTDATQSTWEMQEGPGQLLTASYTFRAGYMPTPGAASALVLAGVCASRRRR